MSHLTEEQFEDVLREGAHAPEHVDRCALCRARLGEKRALAQRVRQAFLSMEAPAALAERMQSEIRNRRRGRLTPLYVRRHLWSGLAAVAALLIVAVPIGFYVGTSSQANAAQVALAEIHHANLNSLGQLVNNPDPNALCAYFESQMGHSPTVACPVSGMTMCGCCVRHFQGRPVASYVVERNRTPISVIAVPQSPEILGLTLTKPKTPGRDIWQARHQCCNIAAVRMGAYSYCAVGQATHEELTAVLNALPEQAQPLR